MTPDRFPAMLRTALALVCALSLPGLAGEFVVSPTGDDDTEGSPDKPYRTIQKAADVMGPGDTCTIEGGIYRETIRVKASGTPGKPIRFVAGAGETVVLSGTEPIRGAWSVHEGKIYKTKVRSEVSQLFVDGEMMVEARWPNQPFEKRWDKSTWRATFPGSAYGKIVDAELAKTGVDWTGAMASLNVGSWETYLRPVTNHAAGKDSFEYAKDLGTRHQSPRIQKNRTYPDFDHYFLFGKLEALDAPGEWFLDRKTRALYLWPPDGRDLSKRRVEGKAREYGFVVSDSDHVRLEGVRFFASTFLLDNANDCLVEDCTLDYPTYVGPPVKLDGTMPFVPRKSLSLNRRFLGGIGTLSPTLISGERNVVRNCRIAYSEAPGVVLYGSENTIENCLIHDIDWRGLGNGVVGNCSGVYMGSSARTVFRRNTVHHVGSSEGVTLSYQGPHLCEYNYIHHAGIVQSDGGLIQCSGIKQMGSIIRYNWTHDHLAFKWGGTGIRGDDLTRKLIVHHNVAWRCNEKGIMIKGDDNRAYNNTACNNPSLDLILWAAEEPFKPWAPQQHKHLVKVQNVHSKAYNNYAPVITGQMHHEVRRAKKVVLPAAELSHNYSGKVEAEIGRREIAFRKEPPPLEAPEHRDFRPAKGSPLVDAGRVVKGITEGHVGKAPDIGAYERGCKSYWIPGYQAPQASMPIPPNEASGVRLHADLMWLIGYKGTSSDVYVGTDAKAVAAADRTSPLFRGNQEHNIFTPPAPKPGAICYWRVDTVTPTGTVKGDVWQFTFSR